MGKIIILFFLAMVSFFARYILGKFGEKVQEEKQVDEAIGYLILLPVCFFFNNYVIMFGFNNYFAPVLGVNSLTYWQVCFVVGILNLLMS